MAAAAVRSCRRGLSQLLSNGGVTALSSTRLQGLSECSPGTNKFVNAELTTSCVQISEGVWRLKNAGLVNRGGFMLVTGLNVL